MVIGGCHVLRFQVLGHPVNNVGVLGMDHGRDAESPGRMHDVQDLVIAQLKGFVCHVYLDTGDAVRVHHHGEVDFKHMFCRIGQDHVETIVAVRLTVCQLGILFQHRHKTLVIAKLARESDDRGRASGDGTACARIVSVVRVVCQIRDLSVGDLCPHEAVHRSLVQLAEMDMRVDTARCDIGSLSIEDFNCTVMRGKKTTSNGEYFPVLDPSVLFSIGINCHGGGRRRRYRLTLTPMSHSYQISEAVTTLQFRTMRSKSILQASSSKRSCKSNGAVESLYTTYKIKVRVFSAVLVKNRSNLVSPFCLRQPRRIERPKGFPHL